MIPDRYQPLCDEHNRRMFNQHRQERRKFIASAIGLSLFVFLLFLLLVLFLRWFGS